MIILFTADGYIEPFMEQLVIYTVFHHFLQCTINILLHFHVFFIHENDKTIVRRHCRNRLCLLRSAMP